MTEQEKREYAIDIYKAGIALDATDFAFGVDGDSHFDRLAEHLAKLGYRKEEEVQKETAKEIFAELRSHCMTSETENCYGEVVIPKSYTWWEDDLNKLEKKFGVEVKE